jgi:hypothetical protein
MVPTWSFAMLGCLLLACVVGARFTTNDSFIDTLFERISKEQVLQDQPYKTLVSWQKIKGTYSSNILLNFHGNFLVAEARRLLQIYDNNMFVATLVTSSLLEAYQHGQGPQPLEEQLILSMNAIKGFQDQNKPYNTSVMTFWRQQFNTSTNYWQSVPTNLIGSFQLLDSLPLSLIEAVLRALGLPDWANNIQAILDEQATYLTAFHIPPDFDDTFGNLALGSLLLQQKGQFPVAWGLWESHNPNLTSVFDALKKYAYRPFSADPNLNSIDPRSYFHIRGFLDQAQEIGQDIALVPTWVQNIEEVRREYALGVAMPFCVNNVDVTVSANVIYGITRAVLGGLVSPLVLEDAEIAQIYLNTSSLIAFEIMNNFSGRPDLALTYYPSRLEFYWFVTRTGALLDSAVRNGTLPLKIMETVYSLLLEVMENHMTDDILGMAKQDGAGRVYFDDFLGDGDVKEDGEPLNRGQDRIFTTAIATNGLIFAWTYYDAVAMKYFWKAETPSSVRQIVQGSIAWLRQYGLDGGFDPWNAFFSGSVKSFETLPFWYPGNRFEYLNGTAISDWSTIPNATIIYAMQGYVPQEQYDAMLKEQHFGYPTPLTFSGYNNGSSFPLWSSVPYTYSTTLLAASRFSQTLNVTKI